MNEEHIPLPPEVQPLREFTPSLEGKFLSLPQDKLSFDPAKGEVIITFSQENREARHPFQDFLYALRTEGVKASTSEWIDLQKALAEGEIESLDDLYIVSRALLVKDVTNYPDFDTVFGRMFYGVEPPQPEPEADYYDDYDEPEEEPQSNDTQDKDAQVEQEDKPEQKEKEDIQDVAESTSQTSEDVHGGNEATKDIKDSPNAANQGEQLDNHGAEEGKSPESQQQSGEGGGQEKKNAEGGGNKEEKGDGGGQKKEEGEGGGKKNETGEGGDGKKDNEAGGGKHKDKKKKPKGIIKEGKGGNSARERVVERRYDQFETDQVLNYEQLGRALSKLTTIIREATEVPTGRLDAPATVRSIADHAGLPELVWQEESEKKPHVVLMFDVGGSTDDFRPIMEKLFAAAKDYLDDVEVFYFHNAPYGEVWPQKDGNWGKHFLPMGDILKKDQDSRVIIVGDAWMAENELWDSGDGYDETTGKQKHFPSGMESLEDIRKTFDHVVWINPILEQDHDEMDNSGTIADIKKVFDMYDLSLGGIERAVRKLMEE